MEPKPEGAAQANPDPLPNVQQQIIEKRRHADFITPIPKPRKRKGRSEQQYLVLDEGAGISTAEQVRDVQRYADAVVVGSAIVAEMERLGGASDLARRIGEFTRGLNC